MVAELTATLSRLGLKDRTTIILTSDHGEEFRQHTERGAHHGHTLYDELLRISLIWDEVGSATGAEESGAAVRLVDLVATIVFRFDLTGPERVDDVDISPLLGGKDWQPVRPLFAEGVLHGPARFSIRTSQGKLVWKPNPERQQGERKKYPVPVRDRHELYLPGDLGEENNVSDEFPGLRAELFEKLPAHLNTGATAAPAVEAEPLNEETKEQSRRLGYAE